MQYPQDYGLPEPVAYAREIYQLPGVADTVSFDIYKQGYFSPSPLRNPLGIIPADQTVTGWNHTQEVDRTAC